MSFPLFGFIAQVTLFAFPFCWLLRLYEKWIIKIKSDFWDAFLVSFLSLIGTTAIGKLLLFLLAGTPWVVYDIVFGLCTTAIWVGLIRGLLKHDFVRSIKISILLVISSYVLVWLLSLVGIRFV